MCLYLKNIGEEGLADVKILFHSDTAIVAHDFVRGIVLNDSSGQQVKDLFRHFCYGTRADIDIPNFPSEVSFQLFFVLKKDTGMTISCLINDRAVLPSKWVDEMSSKPVFSSMHLSDERKEGGE